MELIDVLEDFENKLRGFISSDERYETQYNLILLAYVVSVAMFYETPHTLYQTERLKTNLIEIRERLKSAIVELA